MQDPSDYDLSVHEVRGLRPRLRSDLTFRRHTFRTQTSYIAQDPVTGQYHRFGPAEYRFLRRLDGQTTVGDAIRAVTGEVGEESLSVAKASQLLQFLRSTQLLHQTEFTAPNNLFRQHVSGKERRRSQKLKNFLFISIPLVDPDKFLNRLAPYAGALFGRAFFGIWILMLGIAITLAIGSRGKLLDPVEGLFAPDQLLYFYLMFLFTKLFHEAWHGLACKRFGGSVHEAGILFLVFTPCLYVDASSAWRSPSKWQRIFVSAAGMYIEIFIASIATVVWALTQPGLMHGFAYKIMFLASVSTLLFNGNPLLRYDAYYMMADWLEMPNLWQNAGRYLKYLSTRYLLGVPAAPPTESASMKAWFVGYGTCSFLYRVLVITGIIWFISSMFFELGMILGVVAVVNWVLVPAAKLLHFALLSQTTKPYRLRSSAVTLGAMAALIAGVGLVDAPMHLTASAVVTFETPVVVRPETAGWVTAIRVRTGQRVDVAQPLAVLENRPLQADLVAAEADLTIARIRSRKFAPTDTAAALAEENRVDALRKRVAYLKSRVDALVVRAPASGVILTSDLEAWTGRYLPAGHELLMIGDYRHLTIVGAIRQEDIDEYRNLIGVGVEVKLERSPSEILTGRVTKVHPRAGRTPRHPALTSMAGGPLLLDPSSTPEHPLLIEPHFIVEVEPDPSAVSRLAPGSRGVWRIEASRRPLAQQWYRALIRKITARVWL